MNPIIIRVLASGLLIGIGWSLGYYFGAERPRASRITNSEKAFSNSVPDETAKAFSSTTVSRLMEGKSEFRAQGILHQYADTLDAAAMPGAVTEAMQLPLHYRNIALTVLFARWAELDSAAATKYVDLLPASADPSKLRGIVLEAWAKKDFAGALAWARSLEKGASRAEALTLLAAQLAKSDPSEAMKLVENTFHPWQAGNAYQKIFGEWAKTDFAGALAAAREITNLHLRSSALRAALAQHVETDPRAVLSFVRHSNDNDLRWGIGVLATRRWFERDFAAAREYVLTLPAGQFRGAGLGAMGGAMAQSDPRKGLADAAELSERDRETVTCCILESWSHKDPAAAIEAARGLPEGELRDGAIGRVAQIVVASDANAAFALIEEIPEGPLRDLLSSSIATYLGETEPARAAEWYSRMVSGKDREEGLTQILSKWTRFDPDAALNWAAGRPNASDLAEVIQYMARELTGDEPDKIVARIEQLPIDAHRAAVRGVAQRWSFSDPEAAAAWARGLRDEKAQANAMGALAGEWGNREPAAAARWIESLPSGLARDEAVSTFSGRTAHRDPEGSIAWALTIEDSSKQAKTAREVFDTWLKSDSAAAGKWLQTARDVPDQLRTDLQKMLAQKADE
jgi:hypothetical protein